MPLAFDRLSNADLLTQGHARIVPPLPQFRPLRSEIPGTIYVLQAPPVMAVKIGFTRAQCATIRAKGLQSGNPYPLKVIAQATALPAQEFALHRLLRAHRLEGEWFEWTPEVSAFVAAMADGIEAALSIISRPPHA